MKTFPQIVLGLLLLASFSQSALAEKSGQFCNLTGQKIWVAFGYTSWSIPYSRGWYAIADSSCKRFIADSDVISPLYAYAIGENGTEYLPSQYSKRYFCIRRSEGFMDFNAAVCGAIDHAFKGAIQWQEFAPMTPDGFSLHDYKWNIE